MKKLVLPILTCMTLINPCLNAGWADWISENLSKSWQVDKEYRDEVKYIQKNAGNPNVPIIFVNTNDKRFAAVVGNVGIGFCRFAIMCINQEEFAKNSPSYNTFTLAHETAHIDQNHFACQKLAVLTSLALYLVPLKRALFAPQECTLLSAVPTCLAFGIAHASLSDIRKIECEADRIAFEKLAKLGYCKALQSQHSYYNKFKEDGYPATTHIYGENYPTLQEYIDCAAKACAACVSINPARRPDTPNLMRNGVPKPPEQQKQAVSWYEWFFVRK